MNHDRVIDPVMIEKTIESQIIGVRTWRVIWNGRDMIIYSLYLLTYLLGHRHDRRYSLLPHLNQHFFLSNAQFYKLKKGLQDARTKKLKGK